MVLWALYLDVHFMGRQKPSRQADAWTQGQRDMAWSGLWQENDEKVRKEMPVVRARGGLGT